MQQPDNRTQRYEQLFVGIDSGLIKIPKFQREFVWSKDQTAALLDSLIKGFPIGTFIYWETKDELRYEKEVGNFELPSAPKGHLVSYVLDGQQRITSLYAVRKGAIFKKDDGQQMDYKDISIDLSRDLDEDEQIVFASRAKSNTSMISVFDLLNVNSIMQLVDTYERNEIINLEKYKRRLESYTFSTIVIGQEYSIDVATDVFTRINTSGTDLSLFEIMVAKTYSEQRNFDLSQKYDDLIRGSDKKNLENAGYGTIPPSTVLQCVAIYLSTEIRKKDILRLDKSDFISSWKPVKKGIFGAVDFLRNNLRVPVSNLLPYNALLVPLTYFFVKQNKKPSQEQVKFLTQYFWWASLSHRFSSASDSSLTADRKRMERILHERKPSYRGEEVELSETTLRECWFSTGDAFCKAILCLYASLQPKSFDTGGDVRIDNSWLQRINSKNYHHFFPRSYLEKKGYEDWQANSVLNITIVDDYLNKRQIGTKAPSIYMQNFAETNDVLSHTMKTHLIYDLDDFGVWTDDYDKFLDRRAKRILKELNKRLKP